MSPARNTSAARADSAEPLVRPQRRSQPRQVTRQLPTSKFGWDRKFRVVMILVFLLVSWVAFKAATSVLSSHSQASAESALVQKYSRENHRLEHEAKALTQPQTIVDKARQLGMAKHGEQPLVVTGIKPEGN